jgi:hypothetical protein
MITHALKIPYLQPTSAASKAGVAITSLARLTVTQPILKVFTASIILLIQAHSFKGDMIGSKGFIVSLLFDSSVDAVFLPLH